MCSIVSIDDVEILVYLNLSVFRFKYEFWAKHHYVVYNIAKVHKFCGWRTWNTNNQICDYFVVVFVVVICWFCPHKCTSHVIVGQMVCPNILIKCQSLDMLVKVMTFSSVCSFWRFWPPLQSIWANLREHNTSIYMESKWLNYLTWNGQNDTKTYHFGGFMLHGCVM